MRIRMLRVKVTDVSGKESWFGPYLPNRANRVVTEFRRAGVKAELR